MTRNNTENIMISRTTITRKQKWEEKQLPEYFKQETGEMPHEKTKTWQRKDNPKRESESLLIAAQNNAIQANYVKAKIDKMQQNSKGRLCGDRDETINHISKCSKLVPKENKTKYGWVRKVIHWKLCKKFRFNHTT